MKQLQKGKYYRFNHFHGFEIYYVEDVIDNGEWGNKYNIRVVVFFEPYDKVFFYTNEKNTLSDMMNGVIEATDNINTAIAWIFKHDFTVIVKDKY